MPSSSKPDLVHLAEDIRRWSSELGFQQTGITEGDLQQAETLLDKWLQQDYHGSMDYMARHGTRRSRPAELVPGTLRIISVRMDYLPDEATSPQALLEHGGQAYVSRYALGRDYHKLMRRRLQQLADKIEQQIGDFGYRAFVDSAPVMEKPLAENAGLGWIGKHTNLINKDSGSWFFLGELFTDLPLPVDTPAENHCGSCAACIDVCPTDAIIAPYVLDSRRCISYLTIENRGSIPHEFRDAIGNRIYGCDDCQLFCPWNKFAQHSPEKDFSPRQQLDRASLLELFNWSEEEWLEKTRGSAIRRIGHESWLRNIAVALGNATPATEIIAALEDRATHPSELVREHVQWALRKQNSALKKPA
ncbi:MAG: tRNA epoxyqueuosine(34) reductase QueG [Gammaproteobacteria bacterium]